MNTVSFKGNFKYTKFMELQIRFLVFIVHKFIELNKLI